MTTLSRSLLGIILLAVGAFATPAMAQDPAATFAAHIHAGTCDALGDIVAPLTALTVPTGERAGARTATSAASSYTTVAGALDALLAAPHAIDVHRGADDLSVACGEIGGVRDGNGALSVGLRPVNSSGFSGIAYLGPVAGNPSQTGISTFLAETGAVAGSAESSGSQVDAATYASTVRAQLTLIVASLQRVDTLFDNPNPGDQAWLSQVNAEMSLWQVLHRDARDLVPPVELADFHTRYLEALALLDSAALDVTEGFAAGDQARLTQADGKIDQAIAALQALNAGGPATPAATPATGG
jgi:hypothetical protein